MSVRRVVAALATTTLVAAGLAAATQAQAATSVPRFDHIVIVMMENHAYSQINGSSSAPYLNSLAAQGAKFTQSYAITHPSQPNYIALFSGSAQGVTDDSCPRTLRGNNLATQLDAAGLTFAGYSEDMPSNGYTGCSSGDYRRKHNPWVNFTNVPANSNRTFDSFPSDYASLPTVSIVVPDMCNDMHDCSVGTGDRWLKNNIDGYAQWAEPHNSLLVVTFDEDNHQAINQIFTVFVGAHVQVGAFSRQVNHYGLLRTIQAAYDLPTLNGSDGVSPVLDVWQ